MAVILATVGGWIAALNVAQVIMIASTAYQMVQAKKMRAQARAAAESRKGFELVTEGDISSVPIVYGRALVGGTRVYHNVSNNFTHVTSNADKTLGTAGLSSSRTGDQNEYLFFQQVLCQGPINAVYDVRFDESRYLDDATIGASETVIVDNGSTDPVTGEWVPSTSTNTTVKSAVRIECHYGNTPKTDALIAANFGERVGAEFTLVKDTLGLAYTTTVIKLNRDEAQFTGVPAQQFFVEGRKIRTFINSTTLSSTLSYSNNPALVLLDYLLDKTSGKGLPLSELDLNSFYEASVVCAQIVQSNVVVGGKVFRDTLGTRNITSRDLPLYECNTIIDTSKPIRENIESILSTMGDARLVWSEGKYKLSLQYPATNSAIDIATELTDDDLILNDNVDIAWPTASEKLNHCTVRFHNESENFKEDTVSWPSKTSGSFFRGVNGKKYNPVSGWNDTPGGQLLNSVGVWDGATESTTVTYKIIARITASHLLEYTVDNDLSSISVYNDTDGVSVFSNNVLTDWSIVKTANVSLIKDKVYTITISATNTGNIKGVAARLKNGISTVWTTRDDAYTDFISGARSDSVYNDLLAEDSGVELEADVFADGVTDYYHALAKAEELVRTSRSAFSIKLKYIIKDNFLEPGDFIRLNSDTLNLFNIYLRVNEVKVQEGSVCEIGCSRFDYTQLAWNVKDDEYLKPSNAYAFALPAPTNVVYTAQSANLLSSVGRLDWDDVKQGDFQSYVVYMHLPGQVDNNQEALFQEIGRSAQPYFVLPALTIDRAIFGVRLLGRGGKLSGMGVSNSNFNTLVPASDRSVKLLSESIVFIKKINETTVVPSSITLTAETSGFYTPTYKWFIDDVESTLSTVNSLTVPSFTTPTFKTIRVVVRESGTTITRQDQVSLFYLSEGSEVLSLGFSDDSFQVSATPTGSIKPGQLPKTISLYTALGSELLPPSSVTYSIVTTGCTATLDSVNALITINAVTESFGSIQVTATTSTGSQTRNISISKVLDGQTVLPRIARIAADQIAFVTPSNSSVVVPSVIEVESLSSGFDDPEYRWYVDDVLQTGETNSTFNVAAFPVGVTKKITLQVYELAEPTLIRTDYVTLYSFKEGNDALSLVLSDENRTVPANASGGIEAGYGSFTVSSQLFRGATNVTTTIGAVYTLVNNNNIAATINSSTGVMSVTGLSANAGSVTIRATTGTTVINKIFTMSKAIAGAVPRIATISAAGIAFVTPSNGTTPSPSSIAVSSLSTGFTSPVYSWTIDGVTQSGATSSSLTIPSFAVGSTRKVGLIVSEAADPSLVRSDFLTLYSFKEGNDAYALTLSDENRTVPADANGAIEAGYESFSFNAKLFRGASDVTTTIGATYLIVNNSGISATINSSTGVISVTGLSVNAGSLTVRATVNGVTIDKIFTMSKAIAGAVPRIAIASPERIAFVTPSNGTAPSPSTILVSSLSTGFISPVYSWTVDGVVQSGATSSTFNVSSFAVGTSKRIGLVVSESGTPSLTRSDFVTLYSFKEGNDAYALTLSDENRTVPASSTGVIQPGFETFTISAQLFRGSADITSSGGAVYTLTNNTGISATINSTTGVMSVTGMSSNAASVTVRATLGATVINKIFTMSKAIAGANGTNGTSGTDGADGTPGADGPKSITLDLYQWSTVLPGNPSGTTTYTWSNGTHSNYTGINSWQTSVPSNPGLPGIKLYQARKTFTVPFGDVVSSMGWSTGSNVSDITQNGLDGANGAAAKSAFIISDSQVFQISKSGGVTPGNITLTAVGQNISGTPSFSVTSGTATLAGSGLTRSLLYSSMSTDSVTVSLSWDGLNDSITIVKVREGLDGTPGAPGAPGANGVDGLTVVLTNEAHTLAAEFNGFVNSYSGSGTQIRVYEGATLLTATGTVNGNSQFTIGTPSVDPSGFLTVGFRSYSGTAATVGDHSGFANSMDSVVINYPISIRRANGTNVTVNRSQTITKSKAGSDGAAGANGLQVAKPKVFQWSPTIPFGPSGTSTYTWATGAFSPIPSGWSATPGTSPSVGFTLYQAETNLVDSATISTSAINWTTAIISAIGYAGTNGANGAAGTQGASARLAYARIANNPTPFSGTYTVGGDSLPNFTNTWGFAFNTSWSTSDPSPSSNDTLYQSDGIYNPATNQTVWSTPYISSLKVGTLSAITANMGTLTSGEIIVGSAPQITGDGTYTNMSGSGFRLYPDGGFVLGKDTATGGSNISYSPAYGKMFLNGQIVNTANIANNAVTSSNSSTVESSSTTQSNLYFNISLPSDAFIVYIWVDGGEYFYSRAIGSGETTFIQSGVEPVRYKFFINGNKFIPGSPAADAVAVGSRHWAQPITTGAGTYGCNLQLIRPGLQSSIYNTKARVSWLILRK